MYTVTNSKTLFSVIYFSLCIIFPRWVGEKIDEIWAWGRRKNKFATGVRGTKSLGKPAV